MISCNKWRLSAWALEPTHSMNGSARWSNDDMDPVPIHLRTWTTWNYVAYWVSDTKNPTMWELASSMIATGLSWQQALAAISVGHILISVVILLNGTMGARLHIAFPASDPGATKAIDDCNGFPQVIARASFGFWFSYLCVLSRIILAMFWFGIQTYVGAECTYQMLKAIWPSLPQVLNHLSGSSGITSAGMTCFFIFWLIQFPFLLVSPRCFRHLFVAKAVLVPVTFVAIMTWAMVRAPPHRSLAFKPDPSMSRMLTWKWLSSLNSAIGGWATLSINIPDFTRYAVNEKAQYTQMFILPASVTLVGFCGIAVASASEVLYGEVIWDPLKMVDHWDSRAAILGTNISANSLSAANYMTVLWPKYLNIRRGQVVCAILGGWAICPWKILASAPGFLTFMSGYSIFLGPFAAIMVVDYWIIHRGKMDVDALCNPRGRYRYWNGLNWRAAVAFLIGFLPNIPGLIASLNSKLEVNNILRIFDIAWIYGFSSASLAYWILSTLFPADETFVKDTCGSDHDVGGEEK
ncbi:permease for cytosine/purines, uracil, thiamine, allantoin-domain-containing protein [Mycena maculata]|uniref:Permease for cytosine/purines, uracil, thiamine, allantoin-domain-containing protein n=1 Tax=Mycena maculata TaxID=230809 RepID=A0AAD7J9V5_9AGAR|nr:permease for cytosine/purines, uracil, thiamine, allantoin-domain-containing protein [Mycena maculata]